MEIFEIGKSYEANDPCYDPITVTRRTDKTIWVDSGSASWRMRIKHDNDGNEIVTDSSAPRKWRDVFTYSSRWVCE